MSDIIDRGSILSIIGNKFPIMFKSDVKFIVPLLKLIEPELESLDNKLVNKKKLKKKK